MQSKKYDASAESPQLTEAYKLLRDFYRWAGGVGVQEAGSWRAGGRGVRKRVVELAVMGWLYHDTSRHRHPMMRFHNPANSVKMYATLAESCPPGSV